VSDGREKLCAPSPEQVAPRDGHQSPAETGAEPAFQSAAEGQGVIAGVTTISGASPAGAGCVGRRSPETRLEVRPILHDRRRIVWTRIRNRPTWRLIAPRDETAVPVRRSRARPSLPNRFHQPKAKGSAHQAAMIIRDRSGQSGVPGNPATGRPGQQGVICQLEERPVY